MSEFSTEHWIHISVQSSSVSVVAQSDSSVLEWYRDALNKLFSHNNERRSLPAGNISLAVSLGDFNNLEHHCHFSSSSPQGHQSVFNFQDVHRWARNETLPAPLPWDERQSVPVFRGTFWFDGYMIDQLDKELNDNVQGGMSPDEARNKFFHSIVYPPREQRNHKRLHLVYFSKQHPELLNARFTPNILGQKFLWEKNETYGFDRVLPYDEIRGDRYLTEYKIHVIMGGIGAAFRTARIMSQEIAVIMQDYPYKEWFMDLMEPWVHYIPLEQDLSNLNETLHWVKGHPSKVRAIAKSGKAFYDEYLSYERMDDFYYELIFRLMQCCRTPFDVRVTEEKAGNQEKANIEEKASQAAGDESISGENTSVRIALPLHAVAYSKKNMDPAVPWVTPKQYYDRSEAVDDANRHTFSMPDESDWLLSRSYYDQEQHYKTHGRLIPRIIHKVVFIS